MLDASKGDGGLHVVPKHHSRSNRGIARGVRDERRRRVPDYADTRSRRDLARRLGDCGLRRADFLHWRLLLLEARRRVVSLAKLHDRVGILAESAVRDRADPSAVSLQILPALRLRRVPAPRARIPHRAALRATASRVLPLKLAARATTVAAPCNTAI